MASQHPSPQAIAARVIPAIGRPEFPDRLLSVYRELAGCDLCSAFSWDAQRGPRLLFAAGAHPKIPEFALTASRAYAHRYWRLDAAALRRVQDMNGLALLRMAATDIRNADYRRDCYQRGGIGERLMLFDTAGPTVSVSGYRTLARGPMTARTAQRMQEAGPILVAALRRHSELVDAQKALAPSRAALLHQARECGLSAREAQVVAGLASGQSQSDIAKSTALALNSIITYRRRAYEKLKVADRRELRAMLCERLRAPAET